MLRSTILLSVTLLFLVSLPFAEAQDSLPKTTEEACKQFETADAKLNEVYQDCLISETVQSQASLQKAQRLWVECRDLTARACQTGESSRHAIDDNYYYYARTVLTRSRIKELQALFLERGLSPQ